jgi:hypothetical protein
VDTDIVGETSSGSVPLFAVDGPISAEIHARAGADAGTIIVTIIY